MSRLCWVVPAVRTTCGRDPDAEEDFVEGFEIEAKACVRFSESGVAIDKSVEEVSVAKSGAGLSVTSTIKGLNILSREPPRTDFLKFTAKITNSN